MSDRSQNISPEMRARYRESRQAVKDFRFDELKRLRVLLRRVRYLATQLASSPPSAGREFVEREFEALIFVLEEIEYLDIHA